ILLAEILIANVEEAIQDEAKRDLAKRLIQSESDPFQTDWVNWLNISLANLEKEFARKFPNDFEKLEQGKWFFVLAEEITVVIVQVVVQVVVVVVQVVDVP